MRMRYNWTDKLPTKNEYKTAEDEGPDANIRMAPRASGDGGRELEEKMEGGEEGIKQREGGEKKIGNKERCWAEEIK